MINLYVGNLSFDTTESDLESAFGNFGTVGRASVVRDRESGRSRGFGFVEMTDHGEGTRAMAAMNGQDLNGRTLSVNEARPREERSGGHRPGGGGFKRRESRW